jgi:thioredoxin-related protein
MRATIKTLFLASLVCTSIAGRADAQGDGDLFEMILEVDLKQDARMASRNGKHLMIMFVKEGCAPCIRMKKTVLSDPVVQGYFRQNFISYQVNIFGDLPIVDINGVRQTEKQYAKRQGIWGTPVFYFLGEDGRLVYKRIGFIGKQDFMKIGKYVSAHGYEALETVGRH